MPTLNWIGKDAVVKQHQDVPFRLLEPVPGLSFCIRSLAVYAPAPAVKAAGFTKLLLLMAAIACCTAAFTPMQSGESAGTEHAGKKLA